MEPTNDLSRTTECNLPEGWRCSLLDKVAQRGSGHTPNKKQADYWAGSIKWVSLKDSNKLDQTWISETQERTTEAGIKNSSAVIHPAGSVIVSRDAGVGKSAILADDMAVSQHFIAWRCGPDIYNLYLYYVLQQLKPVFERVATGSTIKTIGLGFFKTLNVVLPPLAEQKAIAKLLDDADTVIRTIQSLVATKMRHKRALSEELLTGGRRFSEFVDTGVWREVALGDILSESRIPATNSHAHARLTVRLYAGGVEARPLRLEAEGKTAYYERKAGQFIYGKQNLHHGAVGIVPASLDGYTSSGDVPAFDWRGDIEPGFVLKYLSRRPYYEALEIYAKGTGSKRIHPDVFGKIKIVIPPTLPEQQAIAECLSLMDEEIRLLQSQCDASKKQKQGLMQSLLTGQVRLPQFRPEPEPINEESHANP